LPDFLRLWFQKPVALFTLPDLQNPPSQNGVYIAGSAKTPALKLGPIGFENSCNANEKV
jgi:hypothetical protein